MEQLVQAITAAAVAGLPKNAPQSLRNSMPQLMRDSVEQLFKDSVPVQVAQDDEGPDAGHNNINLFSAAVDHLGRSLQNAGSLLQRPVNGDRGSLLGGGSGHVFSRPLLRLRPR